VCPVRDRACLRASSVGVVFDWGAGLCEGVLVGLLRASARFLSVVLATSVASMYLSLGGRPSAASTVGVVAAVAARLRAVACALTRTFSFCVGSSAFLVSRSWSVATVTAEQVAVVRRSAFTLLMRRRVGSSLVAI
jgi:hypothetical protein